MQLASNESPRRVPVQRRSVDLVEPGSIGRIRARMRPDEGWYSLPLVLLLTGTMAWSIADARWILGRDELTSFLIWVALAGALWGYLSARLDLPAWLAQALGAPLRHSSSSRRSAPRFRTQPGLTTWFQATANSVTQAYLDLTWRHQVSTLQVGPLLPDPRVLVWGPPRRPPTTSSATTGRSTACFCWRSS